MTEWYRRSGRDNECQSQAAAVTQHCSGPGQRFLKAKAQGKLGEVQRAEMCCFLYTHGDRAFIAESFYDSVVQYLKSKYPVWSDVTWIRNKRVWMKLSNVGLSIIVIAKAEYYLFLFVDYQTSGGIFSILVDRKYLSTPFSAFLHCNSCL